MLPRSIALIYWRTRIALAQRAWLRLIDGANMLDGVLACCIIGLGAAATAVAASHAVDRARADASLVQLEDLRAAAQRAALQGRAAPPRQANAVVPLPLTPYGDTVQVSSTADGVRHIDYGMVPKSGCMRILDWVAYQADASGVSLAGRWNAISYSGVNHRFDVEEAAEICGWGEDSNGVAMSLSFGGAARPYAVRSAQTRQPGLLHQPTGLGWEVSLADAAFLTSTVTGNGAPPPPPEASGPPHLRLLPGGNGTVVAQLSVPPNAVPSASRFTLRADGSAGTAHRITGFTLEDMSSFGAAYLPEKPATLAWTMVTLRASDTAAPDRLLYEATLVSTNEQHRLGRFDIKLNHLGDAPHASLDVVLLMRTSSDATRASVPAALAGISTIIETR